MSRTIECPQCKRRILHQSGFRPWCEACDWGLGLEHKASDTFLSRVYFEFGGKLGRQLFTSLRDAPADELRPRFTVGKLLSLCLALPVHLVTLTLFLFGMWCIWVDWFNWILMLIGGVAAIIFARRCGKDLAKLCVRRVCRAIAGGCGFDPPGL